MTATLKKNSSVSVKVTVPEKTVTITPPHYWVCFNTAIKDPGFIVPLAVVETTEYGSRPSGYDYYLKIGPNDFNGLTGAMGDWSHTVSSYTLETSGTTLSDVPVPVTGRVKIEVGTSTS
jgi:hypothetical protein